MAMHPPQPLAEGSNLPSQALEALRHVGARPPGGQPHRLTEGGSPKLGQIPVKGLRSYALPNKTEVKLEQ